MYSNRTWQAALFLAISFFTAGCGGGGPELGQIEGVVTLDGKPVDQANVLFQSDNGPSAIGTTDSEGHYEVIFSRDNPGAFLGLNRVTIGTQRFRGGKEYPETIPARYNRESEMVREVVAGRQTINFDLKSN